MDAGVMVVSALAPALLVILDTAGRGPLMWADTNVAPPFDLAVAATIALLVAPAIVKRPIAAVETRATESLSVAVQ
jgi:hypothetical protein